MIVEGAITWFQLPVQLLINRYHEVNEDADERIRLAMVDQAVARKEPPPQQKIIFASQKKCWSGEKEDFNCAAVPESPLPDDLYGPATDQLLDQDVNAYRFMRQRWLNSGVILGPAKDLRNTFERAQEIADQDPHMQGDEYTAFNQILGEQERERSTKLLSRRAGPTDKTVSGLGEIREYGINLDYESTLSMPTIFSDSDSAFITFSKPKTIDQAVDENNVTAHRVESLDTDVATIRPPFSILSSSNIKPITQWLWYNDSNTPWEDIPLCTNLYTGITPAIISHSASKDGSEARRTEWWNKMWYQPMARDLLNARLAQPERKIMVDKKGREWWNAIDRVRVETEGFGVQTADEAGHQVWVPWAEICSETDQAEVFRDGRGPYWENMMTGG